jgi:hypothetical protein
MKTKQKTFTITETNKKTSEIMAEMRSLFKVWSYYDDAELDKDFPPPKEITIREFEYSVEPTTLDVSAKEGDPEMKGITLRERLLMEILYFKETGKHLDIIGWTICSGSRYSDGDVPGVYFNPSNDGVYVFWYDLDDSGATGGLRQAVSPSSLLPSTLESRLKNVEQFLQDNFKGFTI